jgi:tetratricopeptide (TPR) repeat protein
MTMAPIGPMAMAPIGPMLLAPAPPMAMAFLQSATPEARSAGAAGRADGEYSRGTRSLDKRQYAEAVQHFDRVVDARAARADGALYWKAYALNKLGRRDDALTALAELQKSYPQSRWLNDAKALDVEVRSASGQPVSPDSENDEELKLLALNSLMQSNADRALPTIERMLHGNSSPRVKQQALFVLAQSDSPQARTTIAQIAKGAANPDLQMKAIEFLATQGGRDSGAVLSEVYSSTTDDSVRKAVLNGFMINGDKNRLLQAAKTEKSPELRHHAIQMLGAMGAQNELWQMYQGETSTDLKRALIQAMMVAGMSDRLLEVGRTDKDPKIRQQGIQMYGVSGGAPGPLVALYKSETDRDAKRNIIQALHVGDHAKELVAIAKSETNPELKKHAVQMLSTMNSPEAAEYMMELLK